MLYFANDYQLGAHPKILQALVDTNLEAMAGYGSDRYASIAEDRIRKACKLPQAKVKFCVGGTQTNALVIDLMIPRHRGVLAAEVGHVSTYEAGAIEYTGHEVLTLPHMEGKISAESVEAYMQDFLAHPNHEHMQAPGLVYISQPTEYGTVYSKEELRSLYEACKRHGLYLYIDGARLSYALVSEENDLSLPDMAALCDVFYIGGTKCGTICGEAIVFTSGQLPEYFLARQKQHGALLAKGRLNSVQFATLFEDELYLDIARNAILAAKKLKSILISKGYRLYADSPTNQIFVIMSSKRIEELSREVSFSVLDKYDDAHSIVRFCTSWATTMQEVEELEKFL